MARDASSPSLSQGAHLPYHLSILESLVPFMLLPSLLYGLPHFAGGGSWLSSDFTYRPRTLSL